MKKEMNIRTNSSHTRRATKVSASQPQPIGGIVTEAVEAVREIRTARQEAARQRREQLKKLSNTLKAAVQAGEIEPSQDGTVNGLLREMYAQQGHRELHTFDEWKERGYAVRKGQKAILLWGKPRKKDKEQDEAADDASKTEPQEDFFPVCYVFSQMQVHSIGEAQA